MILVSDAPDCLDPEAEAAYERAVLSQRGGDLRAALQDFEEAATRGHADAISAVGSVARLLGLESVASYWRHIGQNLDDSSEAHFSAGQLVRHATKGSGTVLNAWKPTDPTEECVIVSFAHEVVKVHPRNLEST